MKTSPAGRAFIEQWEGCILSAYDDATDRIVRPGQKCKGTLTIGFGHTTAAGHPEVCIGQTITQEEADSILSADLAPVEETVTRLIKVPLNQNQFDALVSFEFNTGDLATSSIPKKLNAGNVKAAMSTLLAYTRSGGKVMRGLVRRRAAEKKLFLTPIKETT